MRSLSIVWVSGGIALVLGQASMAQVTTNVIAQTMYDDNVYRMQNNVIDSWITSVRPGVQWSLSQDSASYTVEGGADTATFSQSTTGSDNYFDYHLSGQAQFNFDKRNQFEIDASHSHGHDARGTGRTDVGGQDEAGSAIGGVKVGTGLDVDTWRQERLAGQYSYGAQNAPGRMTLSASYTNLQYLNNALFTDVLNSKAGEVRETGYLKLLPRTAFLLEARQKKVNFDTQNPGVGPGTGTRDNFETKYFLGASWEATAKTEGVLRLGRQYHDPDSSQYRNFDSTVWEADVIWRPRTTSALRIDAARSIDLNSSTLSYTDNKTETVNWLQKWNDRMSTEFYAEFVSMDFVDTIRNDHTKSFGINHNYATQDWLTWKFSYRHETRSSTGTSTYGAFTNLRDMNYDRNIYLVGINATFQ